MTIVRVSILVWPKVPSRVHRLDYKVLPCRQFGERRPLDFLHIVWKIERPNSWFLTIWLVKIDSLSTFGHSMKRALSFLDFNHKFLWFYTCTEESFCTLCARQFWCYENKMVFVCKCFQLNVEIAFKLYTRTSVEGSTQRMIVNIRPTYEPVS